MAIWPWGKNSEKKPEPKNEYVMRLEVKYGQMTPFIFECEAVDGKFSILPYMYFIKWYHCRPQSECHTIHNGRDFSSTILRENITSYSITLVDVDLERANKIIRRGF